MYFINCPNLSYYTRTDLEKLQALVASFTHAQFDDIIVCGVRNGCVIVTFMIRNCLIPTSRAFYVSEKQSMTCHQKLKHNIIKVIINDEVVYMPGTIFKNFFVYVCKNLIADHFDTLLIRILGLFLYKASSTGVIYL